MKRKKKKLTEAAEAVLHDMETIVKSFQLVQDFFGGDRAKAMNWWWTPNPLLGDIAPSTMVALRKEVKLLKWIKQQLATNPPNAFNP